MTELNLTELSRHEREAVSSVQGPVTVMYISHDDAEKPWPAGWWVGDETLSWVCFPPDCEAEARLYVAARNQLRPLLDLTEKMARALRGAGRDACLRFNDCPHDCCIWRRSVLEEYRRAGGKMR